MTIPGPSNFNHLTGILYWMQLAGLFHGAEGHTINGGYFGAEHGAKNFQNTKGFTIRDGTFKASNDDQQRNDPNVNPCM